MRNLTIKRNKSLVGCAMKDQVYIRDEQAAEITIAGVPCRKLGDIKNGEEKTFQITEEAQQVFLIADRLSKEYCNASMMIPEGTEDVALSGKHYFLWGSNPFRFDGVQTPEDTAKQRKQGRIGLVITIASVLLGGLFGAWLFRGLFNVRVMEPKTFSKQDFQITLNSDFEEIQEPGFFATYVCDSAMVFVLREDAALFGDLSLAEYSALVLEANNRTDLELNESNGLYWFSYTDEPQTQEIYYMAFCYRSDAAYWVVNFATPAVNQDIMTDDFLQWAASIDVDGAQTQ